MRSWPRFESTPLKRFALNSLRTGNLGGDVAGGLTAAVVALPLAIAFGVASGAGPIAGLYGAICVGLFAALFGGTPAQISGPTGPMTIVAASVFSAYAREPALAFTVVMLAGAFQVLFGLLRLGRFVNLMPYPVISGFLTGIGCIIIVMQLEPMLGYTSPASVVNALSVLPRQLLEPNWQAVAIGVVSLAICLLTPKRIGRIVPPPLRALSDPEHAKFLSAEETELFRACDRKLRLLHLSGLMSFGAASEMTRRFSSVAAFPTRVQALRAAREHIVARADSAEA